MRICNQNDQFDIFECFNWKLYKCISTFCVRYQYVLVFLRAHLSALTPVMYT